MPKKRKKIGFVVVEHSYSGEIEQTLALLESEGHPPGGVLCWRGKGDSSFVFNSRKEAREAINRTEHYRLAFNDKDCPERRFCKVVPLEMRKEDI